MIHIFDPVIYPRKIYVSFDIDMDTVHSTFEKTENWTMEKEDLGMAGSVIHKESNKYGVLILFRNKDVMKPEIIAHESSHAAIEIFNDIGGWVDCKNQEPFAYLVGWITKCVYEAKAYKKKREA